MTNWRRVPEDHDPAARSRTVVPDAMMRAMDVLAIRGISFSPAAQTRNRTDYCEFSTVPSELPQTTELPHTTELPQTTELPPATELPQTTELPHTTELPQTTELPPATELPQTTELPHTTELPQTTELPHTTELPQTTELPHTTELPQTTELPHTTELPQTTEESVTSETVFVDALYVTLGDLAEPTLAGARSVLAKAAEASTAPAPTEKRSCSIW